MRQPVPSQSDVPLQTPVPKRSWLVGLRDETYKGMWISPDVKVLLRTDAPASDGPVAWISPYTKSRVVYIQLGHGESAHLDPACRVPVQDAIRWTGGRLDPEKKWERVHGIFLRADV
jgi:type 1 glutamine amidotransferase